MESHKDNQQDKEKVMEWEGKRFLYARKADMCIKMVLKNQEKINKIGEVVKCKIIL